MVGFKKTLASIILAGVLAFGGGNKAKGALIKNLQFDIQPNPAYLEVPARAYLEFDFIKEEGENFNHFSYEASLWAERAWHVYTEVSSKQYDFILSTTQSSLHENIKFDEFIPDDYCAIRAIRISDGTHLNISNFFAKIENLYSGNLDYVQFPINSTETIHVTRDEAIPEPSTLELLGLGSLVLLKNKRSEK